MTGCNTAPVSLDITSTGSGRSFTKNSPSVPENSLKGTVLGTVVASDPDANAKITFQLDSNAGGKFKLDSSHLVVCSPTTGVKVKVHDRLRHLDVA